MKGFKIIFCIVVVSIILGLGCVSAAQAHNCTEIDNNTNTIPDFNTNHDNITFGTTNGYDHEKQIDKAVDTVRVPLNNQTAKENNSVNTVSAEEQSSNITSRPIDNETISDFDDAISDKLCTYLGNNRLSQDSYGISTDVNSSAVSVNSEFDGDYNSGFSIDQVSNGNLDNFEKFLYYININDTVICDMFRRQTETTNNIEVVLGKHGSRIILDEDSKYELIIGGGQNILIDEKLLDLDDDNGNGDYFTMAEGWIADFNIGYADLSGENRVSLDKSIAETTINYGFKNCWAKDKGDLIVNNAVNIKDSTLNNTLKQLIFENHCAGNIRGDAYYNNTFSNTDLTHNFDDTTIFSNADFDNELFFNDEIFSQYVKGDVCENYPNNIDYTLKNNNGRLTFYSENIETISAYKLNEEFESFCVNDVNIIDSVLAITTVNALGEDVCSLNLVTVGGDYLFMAKTVFNQYDNVNTEAEYSTKTQNAFSKYYGGVISEKANINVTNDLTTKGKTETQNIFSKYYGGVISEKDLQNKSNRVIDF